MKTRVLTVLSEPLTYTEVKAQCRLLNNFESDLLESYISAVRNLAERHTWQVLAPKQFEGVLQAFPLVDYIEVPNFPVTEITSFQYINSDGATQDFTDFEFDPYTNRIVLNDGAEWPSVTLKKLNPIVVLFNAGFTGETIPPEIKQALKLIASNYEQNRDTGAPVLLEEIPFGAKSILSANRRYRTE